MNKRARRTLWILAAVLIILAVAIFLRYIAPPEAARLLPESDGMIYINLRPARAFFHKDLKPPQYAPDYKQFIDATGINWERDLDEAAIALHRMVDPNGPNGPVAYSMVLVGKITGQPLNAWLEAHATSREIYVGHTIYSIPSEGRTVRVAQIGYDMVAISNTPTPEQIHSILDRHATAALPFAGSTLLARHWDYLFWKPPLPTVPLLSRRLVWGVGQIGLPFSEDCNGKADKAAARDGRGQTGLPVPRSCAISILGFSLPLKADTALVASLAPALNGSLHLRVEVIAPSDAEATRQADALNLLLIMARDFTLPLADNATGNGIANRGLKELLKTAEVTQKRNWVVVTATLDHSLFSASAADQNAPPESPSGPAASK
jgi:hypothetical protein